MCERYSWIEKDGHVLFLTANDVFDTERGRELQVYTNASDDWYGHGAIRWFYEEGEGVNRECVDFTSPNYFPPELVVAIKNGLMWRFGISDEMCEMLTESACVVWNEARWQRKGEFTSARDKAGAERDKSRIYNEHELTGSAKDDYHRTRNEAWVEYGKIINRLIVDINAARAKIFAELFANPKNRIAAWR